MAEPERERVIVADGGRRGGGGTVVAILAVIVLLVVLFLLFGRGLIGGETKEIKADVDISAPTGGGSGS